MNFENFGKLNFLVYHQETGDKSLSICKNFTIDLTTAAFKNASIDAAWASALQAAFATQLGVYACTVNVKQNRLILERPSKAPDGKLVGNLSLFGFGAYLLSAAPGDNARDSANELDRYLNFSAAKKSVSYQMRISIKFLQIPSSWSLA